MSQKVEEGAGIGLWKENKGQKKPNKQCTRLQRRQRAPPIVGNHDVIKEAEALTKVTLVMTEEVLRS